MDEKNIYERYKPQESDLINLVYSLRPLIESYIALRKSREITLSNYINHLERFLEVSRSLYPFLNTLNKGILNSREDVAENRDNPMKYKLDPLLYGIFRLKKEINLENAERNLVGRVELPAPELLEKKIAMYGFIGKNRARTFNEALDFIKGRKFENRIVELWVEEGICSQPYECDAIIEGYPELGEKLACEVEFDIEEY